MGINKQSAVAANLQIGPTDQGMVRIYIEADDGSELPLDFAPDEALEIAEELQAAAARARGATGGQGERKETRAKADKGTAPPARRRSHKRPRPAGDRERG